MTRELQDRVADFETTAITKHLGDLFVSRDGGPDGQRDILFGGHRGSSMNPTLCELDLLEIAAYGERKPRVGDIIWFESDATERAVVHRIVEVSDRGIRTRGDNCSGADDWLVHENEISGRVIAARSGKRRRRIAGGTLGRLKAAALRARKATLRLTVRILGPTYRWMGERRPSWLQVPARLRPRTVIFSSPDGGMKLTMGNRQIARFDPLQDRWILKRSAGLFVDEAKLPRP